jgi:hypothetical protein
MDLYAQMAIKIIQGQEAIIGPVAVEQAERISGLKLDWSAHEVSIEGNKSKIIDSLIGVYKELFGQISVEVSKEAVANLASQLPADGLPEALK